MTDRLELLTFADGLLDGTIRLGSRSARTAALLARCAFEDWLNEQCSTWCPPTGQPRPTTSSKLVVLGALRGAGTGERAKHVWGGLSRAVHHHAYELQPSVAEVRSLVQQVRRLHETATPTHTHT